MRITRFTLFGALALFSLQISATPVFVNELHYDDAGVDSGEFLEIAGPAGTDLSGWSVVLYNGATGAPYSTVALAGLLPDQQNGVGTQSISYPTNGIQNGAPDGVALVDDGGNVVQFLSYEGSFNAVGGPADGLSSTDIGVSEGPSTPDGFSLQLVGSGREYEDFSWSGPFASTADAINGSLLPPSDLFFSEYVEGSGFTKAVELFNRTGDTVDMANYQVEVYFNGQTTPGQTLALEGSLLNGEAFVLAHRDAGSALQALADQVLYGVLFNGDDALVLRNIATNDISDSFGRVGEDPGVAWNEGGVRTSERTLRRKGGVFTGDAIEDDAFNPSLQWLEFARDDLSGLGTHQVDGLQLITSAAADVPEPASFALVALGLLLLSGRVAYGRAAFGSAATATQTISQ